LRVLHVYRTYYPDPPGGLQEAIRQIALATKAHGISTEIFALSERPVPTECLRPEGVVIRARSWVEPASCNLGGIAAFARFAKLAKKTDIIHYHFPWPFADLLHLVVKPSVPTVMTYHSDIVRQRWLSRAYAPLMSRTLKSMSALVATSPAYALTSTVLSHTSLTNRVRVIPLGIGERTYSNDGDIGVLRRLGLFQEPFFLFIGVLRYYKGLHTLMRAALSTRAKIVIAGCGPEDTALKGLVQKLGLRNVVFAGQVTDAEKVALLMNCRALILPSHLRSEAYGMVLVEASMFGKPMVSCEIGTGTSFVNQHLKTGFVVAPESPRELAQAINTLLADDILVERFGRAARQRYETYFSESALGKAYADLYREVSGK